MDWNGIHTSCAGWLNDRPTFGFLSLISFHGKADIVTDLTQNKELAVVTGAAVRLGREMAIALARRGYAIGLHFYHSDMEANETASLIEQIGEPVILLQADLRNPSQISSMFQKIVDSPYRLSVLVNSAAQMKSGDLNNLAVEEWDETLALNLRAPWLCSRAAAEIMRTEGGLIVNISDIGVEKTWTGYPAYEISKAGLEMLTRLMARSLAPSIRVNAIAPGLILPPPDFPQNEWKRLYQRLPLKKPGSPEAVIHALQFLVDNKYVTGETLVVDGGYQLL
jgi:NAD(P)-dependent dehydrogenase (short-subunit alcohol dehydrogenase family)